MAKASRTQQLKDELEDDIISGRLRPGDRLDPEALEQRFNVSRTPVREALQQLASSGLVTVAPKKGTFVSSISFTELIQMFEVMAELEAMAGRLAARRITEAQKQELAEALKGCEDAIKEGTSDVYYYENVRFHQCIYASSQNEFLAAEIQRLRNRLQPYRRLQLRVRDRLLSSLQEHRQIYQAIIVGDTISAADALRQHVLIQGERFSDFVSQVQRFNAGETLVS